MTTASVALWTLLAGPSRPARVLEIIAGTVYLQVDPLAAAESRDGRDHPSAVVALLQPDAVRLPIGIVLPPAAAELRPVSVDGSPVGRGEITIGWGAITLAEQRFPILNWWNPGIPALPLPKLSITAEGVAESAASEVVDPLLAAGLEALLAGDAEGAVHRLIGASVADGPIPEGDAVLGGALAALAAWAPDSAARTTLATAVAGALDRTGPISTALLHSAALGFAVPELAEYLTALSNGDSQAAALAGAAGFDPGVRLGIDRQLRALLSGRAQRMA
jgi:hypothetical protein